MRWSFLRHVPDCFQLLLKQLQFLSTNLFDCLHWSPLTMDNPFTFHKREFLFISFRQIKTFSNSQQYLMLSILWLHFPSLVLSLCCSLTGTKYVLFPHWYSADFPSLVLSMRFPHWYSATFPSLVLSYFFLTGTQLLFPHWYWANLFTVPALVLCVRFPHWYYVFPSFSHGITFVRSVRPIHHWHLFRPSHWKERHAV